jgi:glycosyltransferase involved in cell wall biosynthesis
VSVDRRLAFVLWGGGLGGAERFTVALASELRAAGVQVSVVFMQRSEPLGEALRANNVPFRALGFRRGHHILVRPRRVARAVSELGPDGVLLPTSGYLAWVLRRGGYRGRIVAVEHGTVLQIRNAALRERWTREVDRRLGLTACDAQVAVSNFVHAELLRRPHAREVVTIYNGVDLDAFSPGRNPERPTVAFGGRLVRGKGVSDLIRAFTPIGREGGAALRIAGDGDQRDALEALARELGVGERVEFTGPILDMPAFWRQCSVAAVPSNGLVESFCLSAVEPMACGRPVVATSVGALPEIVEDGVTGTLVAPGHIDAMTAALRSYLTDAARAAADGARARERCEERFALSRSVAEYRAIFAA